MNALGEAIRAMIAGDGPLSVERYMLLCLQHPTLGYYTTREAIGRAGDFITAPEVNQMFGELIGLWAAQVWLDMGAPPQLRLVELGPGRGTLMADALRAASVAPGFREAIMVDLVETSPRLRDEQRARLEGTGLPTAWHARVEDVPDGSAIVIANEFFDALPVRHYLRDAEGWHERVVGLDAAGALCFGAQRERVDIPTSAGEPGQVLEVGHVALRVMETIAGRLARQGGALLVCDYGHIASGLGETLQALRSHAYADPLAEPGEADLTTHVDFAALARVAAASGMRPHGPVDQGVFLRRLGIVERAAALSRRASPGQAAAIAAALDRLTAPRSTMATLFKAMAVTPADAPAPPGFAEAA